MATLTICATPPLPTFNSLYQSFQSLLTGPFAVPSFPALPTLPSPIFSGFHSPNIEAVELAAELQCSQILNLILALFKPVVDFLGIAIEDILPTIPFLGVNLIQLLAGDAAAFIKQLEGIAVSTILGIAGLPAQFYKNYVIPALSALQTFQLLVRSYFAALINTLFGLVKQVAHIIGVGALSLPTIPSFGEFFETFALSIINGILLTSGNGISVLTSDIGVIMNLVAIALAALGLPFDSTLPDPLFPSLNMPEFTLFEQLKNLYTNFSMSPLQLLLDFIVNTLHLSVAIPQICISVALPKVGLPPLVLPKFTLPKLPTIPKLPNLNVLKLSLKLPGVGIPSISVPNVSIPNLGNISGASISLPSVTVPSISLPSISGLNLSLKTEFKLPTLKFPGISIPKLSYPHLPFPSFKLPSFKIPTLSIPKIPTIPAIPKPKLGLHLTVQANINITL